jgi:CheY-like chemotaxis protein/two-component sensor histidine kinase
MQDETHTIDWRSRLEARDDFFRHLSHEIRTPLNGVLGMMGLLSKTPLSPDQKAYLDTAVRSGEHLLSLVNDFLDYARLDAGKIEFDTARVALEPLMQSVTELLAPKAHEGGIEIVWGLDAELDQVLSDEGRLKQILYNLAGNAVKFTKSGGVSINIDQMVDSDLENQGIVLTVKDTGPGIAPESQNRIFEAFGQVHPSHGSLYGGVGLGLVVVKKLTEAMNGTIELNSSLGVGTEFCIRFPDMKFIKKPVLNQNPKPLKIGYHGSNLVLGHSLGCHIVALGHDWCDDAKESEIVLVDRDDFELGPPAEKSLILLAPEQRDEIEHWRRLGFCGYLIKPVRRQSLYQRLNMLVGDDQGMPKATDEAMDDERAELLSPLGLNVLLVEDNPVNALLAQALLKREGCSYERVSTGEAALMLIKERIFDLILMDLGLPGRDGMEITRLMHEQNYDGPIYALTANAFEEDRRAALLSGMDGFLTKPIDPKALRQAMSQIKPKQKIAI